MKIPDLLDADIKILENEIDKMNSELPELKEFILPGGHESVSFCHIARCVCRRAERLVVLLGEREFVADLVVIYLNRLSDYLFVLSRIMAKELNADEITWKPRI
jgi:cob(I)alamin adenosyltransferase